MLLFTRDQAWANDPLRPRATILWFKDRTV